MKLTNPLEYEPQMQILPKGVMEEVLERRKVLGLLAKPVKEESLLQIMQAAFGGEFLELAETPASLSGDCAPKLNILLAEDVEINQMVAVELLTGMGHAVDVVDNGRLAVEALARRDYDLVLMDCLMPVLDGYEATRLVRLYESEKNLPRLPILAMTANAMHGDAEKSLAAGMDGHLTKPVSLESLQTALLEYVKK